MKVKLYNKTNNLILLNDIGEVILLPNEYSEFDTVNTPIDKSDMLIKYISKGDVVVNNYTSDMGLTDGIKWLVSGAEQFLTDQEGKIRVHETSKFTGFYTYWTSRGDDTENNIIGEGSDLIIHHKVGDPLDKSVYVDFNNIDNPTQLHEGYMIWDGAKPHDTASCSIVTSTISISAGINTNFNLYGGYLIVPAAGDGTIDVLSDLSNIDPSQGCFVQVDTDEAGVRPPAFWNVDYDPTTKKFVNITPAPMGDGVYNIFSTEIVISRFVNQIHLLGSGFERLQSADSDTMTHGLRIKIESHTTDILEDHEWVFSAIMTLQRDKTI